MSDAQLSSQAPVEPTESGLSRIESAAQYEAALRALSQRSRPPALLRLLMRALESYRQARRMGWSRKQNKVGVTTFSSFKLGPEIRHFGKAACAVIDESFPELSAAHRQFIDEVCSEPHLMGFLFFQEVEEGTQPDTNREYESVTLSFGRVVSDNKRFRDRWDLILDAPILDQSVGGLERMRLFVDPFEEANPTELTGGNSTLGASLLDAVSGYYEVHRDDEQLLWDHWTQDFIDYFGPRTRPLLGSRFPTQLDDAYQRMRARSGEALPEMGAA